MRPPERRPVSLGWKAVSIVGWPVGVALATGLSLAGCSAQPRKAPPSEEEMHAADRGSDRTPVSHLYHCDDGRDRLVDFKDDGLTIELRRDAQATPVVLHASTQGRPYIGKSIAATFGGNELKIEATGGPLLRCTKEVTE